MPHQYDGYSQQSRLAEELRLMMPQPSASVPEHPPSKLIEEGTRNHMLLQRAEFIAASQFAREVNAIGQTAVVDDDYPMVRDRYERSIRHFLRACLANGRMHARQLNDPDAPGVVID